MPAPGFNLTLRRAGRERLGSVAVRRGGAVNGRFALLDFGMLARSSPMFHVKHFSHLPMQNVLKIRSRISPVVVSPINSSSAIRALRTS